MKHQAYCIPIYVLWMPRFVWGERLGVDLIPRRIAMQPPAAADAVEAGPAGRHRHRPLSAMKKWRAPKRDGGLAARAGGVAGMGGRAGSVSAPTVPAAGAAVSSTIGATGSSDHVGGANTIGSGGGGGGVIGGAGGVRGRRRAADGCGAND